jgi:hypothetical protein
MNREVDLLSAKVRLQASVSSLLKRPVVTPNWKTLPLAYDRCLRNAM